MARLAYLTLAVALAVHVSAGAQTKNESGAKVQSVTGVVKAISASSLNVETRGGEITIDVDSSTRVLRAGGRVEPRDLVFRTPGPGITDFVKVGDRVLVRYRQSDLARKAVEVRVARK